MTKATQEITSGIYRLYITIDKTEYSYVGVSKNMDNRIKNHNSAVKRWFANKDGRLMKLLDENTLPNEKIFPWKLATFLLFHKLKLKDIKSEILKKVDYEKTADIELLELDYIKKYNSEVKGFNSVFAKAKAYTSTGTEHYEKLSKNEKKKNQQLALDLCSEKISGEMPWVGMQLLLELLLSYKFKYDDVFTDYIKKVKENLKKRK